MVSIKATPMKAGALKPGDLFSTYGPSYWNHFGSRGSCGECVYIRTQMPSDDFPDADADIFKIEILEQPEDE
jgi:hypothetical protein